MLPLILYDIPSNVDEIFWSPNTARPGFVLGYKDLPFETEWIEFPDIAGRMKEIEAAPGSWPNGGLLYTLPVLRDPNTGAIITDSWDIVVYLENTYPEKPIFPKDTKGLIRAYETGYFSQFWPPIEFLVLRSAEILRECSEEHYITTREKYFDKKLAEFSPEGPVRDQHWSSLEKAFSTTMSWYDKTDGRWFMGSTFSYADIIVACQLNWLKKVLHDDEWRRIAAWRGGEWEEVLADVRRKCNIVQ
ncbi:hypothetical protein V8B97DRAFT_2025088 [Scleroderma yunnanense]